MGNGIEQETDGLTSVPSDTQEIAGFWRRVAALAVDVAILGVIGFMIGLLLAQELVVLGPWGRLVGFSIAMAYFGLFNSWLSGGQTPGKRLLKVKVVTREGSLLSVPRACLRFVPLGLPWFLNGAKFPESVLTSYWLYVISVVVFGLGLSVVYLYIFNRRSRQSVHDLLVGSYVVSAQGAGPVVTDAVWRPHLTICVALLLLSGMAPYLGAKLADKEPYASLSNIQQTVMSEPGVVYAGVTKGHRVHLSGQGERSEQSFVMINAYVWAPLVQDEVRATRLARSAMAADSSATDVDFIQVTLIREYDIGIASWRESLTSAHSPAEWRSLSVGL